MEKKFFYRYVKGTDKDLFARLEDGRKPAFLLFTLTAIRFIHGGSGHLFLRWPGRGVRCETGAPLLPADRAGCCKISPPQYPQISTLSRIFIPQCGHFFI